MPDVQTFAVKFGCCAGADQAEAVAKAGFDFIELPAAAVLQPTSEEGFDPEPLKNLPVPVEAFNIFLPREIAVVGPEINQEQIGAYLQRVTSRAASLGGKVMVFGSGRSRNIPEGFDAEEAWGQLQQFLGQAAPAAEKNGVTIAIEPLNREESNIINTVPDGVRLAKEVGHSNIQALADLYHMMKDDEPLDNVLEAKGVLAHVHVADSGRLAPGTGDYDTVGFFRLLKKINYNGRISVECRWRDFEAEAPAAVEYLRSCWQKA